MSVKDMELIISARGAIQLMADGRWLMAYGFWLLGIHAESAEGLTAEVRKVWR